MSRRIAPEPYQYSGEEGPALPGWSWREKLALVVAILVAWAVLAAVCGGGGGGDTGPDCTPVPNGPYATICE
jgi:hypothetical protein